MKVATINIRPESKGYVFGDMPLLIWHEKWLQKWYSFFQYLYFRVLKFLPIDLIYSIQSKMAMENPQMAMDG